MWSHTYRTDYLAHHGILGMKWGVRRYQNKDGSLTEAGKRRYLNSDGSLKPNKAINARDYYVNTVLSRAEKKTGKKYSLSKEQKKYMDESGNLTIKGGRATIPLGYDLSNPRYKSAKKTISDRSDSWKKYFNSPTDENYKVFQETQNKMLKELAEIDVEEGRKWVLTNVKAKEKKQH